MPEHNRDSTFVFADIAGYTALTEAHGDEQAADLAASFCHSVTKLAVVHGCQVVKTIGDAVMVRVEEPASAVELGLRVAGEVMADHGFPAVRVGMHHGPAVERQGDWFGSAVNLAARVAGLASGGEVLITGAVRAAAEGIEDVRFEDRGELGFATSRCPLRSSPPLATARGRRSAISIRCAG